MSENHMYVAIFPDVDPAADGIEKLNQLGVTNEEMDVISGIPLNSAVFGRPHPHTHVTALAGIGALVGFGVGLFLGVGTPTIYGIHVGGQPVIPIPPLFVVVFEMTMLGMLLTTFFGVFMDSDFPNYKKLLYVPEVSDGAIAVLFQCPPEKQKSFTEALTALGAQTVRPLEAQQL